MSTNKGLEVYKITDLEDKCALWRFRIPIPEIMELEQKKSKSSPEFTIGGVPWRFHIQERENVQKYLAIHLQCLTQDPRGTFGHFKIGVANLNNDLSVEKTFHCHFKKHGSAWGANDFIEIQQLMNPANGFIDTASNGIDNLPNEFDILMNRPVPRTPALCIDALVRVMDPEGDGTYALGNLPQQMGATSQPRGGGGPINTALYRPNASLKYPYPEALCDMTIVLANDTEVATHRCIIACRAPRLIPADMNPLPHGAIIHVDALPEVFKCFLRFVYTEEPPEKGTLRAEYLLDLYMLAVRHELFYLAEQCIRQVEPLLSHENIVPIIGTRYSATDETINSLYLRVLATDYDGIIEDTSFESLPPALNRRLSLIIRGHQQIPQITFPKDRSSLSKDLGHLADSGAYSDHDIVLDDGTMIQAHKVVLASRSDNFYKAFYQNELIALPDTTTPDLNVSAQAWSRFLTALYRATPLQETTPEDIVLVWKLTDALGLDGRLRKESEPYINRESAVRLLIYSEKYNVSNLRDVAVAQGGARDFPARARMEPGLWENISELSHDSILSLFRTVIEAQAV